MAKESLSARWVAFGALAAALTIAVPGHAAVGRTPGSFNASNGTATYSIPIFTPPGPRGIQPSVALTYNSNAGGGILGRGWTLSGQLASSIRMCPRSIAQDGYSGYWYYACIDGNRLREQSGGYWQDGSVYMTEVADFSRITASDVSSGYPGTWTVERKDGLKFIYGGASDARIVVGHPVEWKLKEIRDRAGNKVRFTWKVDDSDSYTSNTSHPVKIEWTQTSAGSGSYVYSMDFTYSAGGNALSSSFYGQTIPKMAYDTQSFDHDLLTAITVSTSGTVKRKYVLTYDNSTATGGKILTQVKECSDSAASDCLAPTNITYQGGTPGFNASTPGPGGDGKYDFNGDGIKDLAYYESGNWKVKFGSKSSGYGSAYNTGITANVALMAGKLTESPGTQLLSASGGTWYVYYWNGSSFSSASSGVTVAASAADVVLADMNGDGRDDIVYTQCCGDYQTYNSYNTYIPLFTRFNTATTASPSFASQTDSTFIYFEEGFPPGFWESAPMYMYWDSWWMKVTPTVTKGGDSDGDGRDEVNVHFDLNWCYYDAADPGNCPWGPTFSTNVIAYYSEAMNPMASSLFGPEFETTDYSTAVLTSTDFNSDGCDDYWWNGAPALSTCGNGRFVPVTEDSGIGAYAGSADWDGDGKNDYFLADSTYLYVRPYVGNTFGAVVNTYLPASYVEPTDSNGDGLDDLIAYGWSYSRNSPNVVPDLVSEIEDGFGVTRSMSYESIARDNHTPTTDATYPYRDMTGGLRVLAKVTASDGVGGTYDTDYEYFGARMNAHGRGFMGFEKIESVDSRTGIKHEQQFEQAFPYNGMVKVDKFYQPAGSGGYLMSSKTVTASSTTLDATAYNERVFTYVSATAEDAYEVGGPSNSNKITSSTTSTTYDSSGNVTASTGTVTDEDASSPLYTYAWVSSSSTSFSPNTTYWCLGLPTATSVTQSTTTGEASVTQSKSFTPDYTNCRMDAESLEPSSSTLRVDTSYGYDSFGNVDSMSITGRNPNTSSMTARTTSTNWGTTGQFPVSATNPLSQTTTRTFHSTFGSLLTETDPNSIVVVDNAYDNFGRVNYVTRPDGTYTAYSYVACATYGCENGDPGSGATGINRVVKVVVERDSSSSDINVSSVYTDQFDRPIVQYSQSMAGQWLRSGRQYDALGRVSRETVPCSASSCTVFWTSNTYDLLGRVTAQSRPQSQSVSTPVTTAFAYAGRTQTVTDFNSKVTSKILDVNGWIRRSRDHDSYGQNFSYDAAGSLIGVTDSLANTLFSASYYYGAKPIQYSTTDMDIGTWSYTYNSLGELVSWQDANTNSFSQTYDALSRVLTRTEAEGTTTWTFGTSAGSHNIGRLAGVSMTNYSEALSYDSVGRPGTRSITADGNTYNIDFAYNGMGLPDTLTYPTSTSGIRVKVKYGYAYGILQTVTDWTSGSAGTVYWTANTQNPRGQTTQETLGNGVVTNRSFDAVTGWLNSIQSGVSGGTGLQNLAYLYDTIGNVTQRQENTQGLTENFYYDNLYRLDHSTLNNGGGAATNLQMAYNAMGNITQRTDVNGNATWSYHSTKKHAVASTGSGGASYSYDANGNMTSRDGQTIGWASYNYPTYLATATENTTFYYGPDRQYFRQDYSGPSITETTYYIGGLLEKVCSSASCISGTIDWRHYITVNGQTVAIVSRKSSGTNAVNYTLEDKQGSGSTLTNSSGSLLVRESFNAFGLPRDGGDWDGAVPSGDLTTIEGISRRGYTGHSMLGRMGLIHMNGRVQDTVTGRFLSPDPTIPNAGFTQSYNRYAYVNNNPLGYVDQSGFTPTDQDPGWVLRHINDVMSIAGVLCGGGYGDSPNCAFYQQELQYYSDIQSGMMLEAWAQSTARELYASFHETVTITISAQALSDAKLSMGIYNKNFKGTDGYTMVGNPYTAENGLRAAVFNKGTDNVLVYAGTSPLSGADWWANLTQAFGFKSAQYDAGINLAVDLYGKYDGSLRFSGHSLGGGIASAAAIVTGGSANTFNAAGVHDNTLRDFDRSNGSVTYYYSTFDIVRIANALTPASAAGTPVSLGAAGLHGMGGIVNALEHGGPR